MKKSIKWILISRKFQKIIQFINQNIRMIIFWFCFEYLDLYKMLTFCYFRKSYYAMSFDFKFEHPADEVYVAYTIPYTYT